LQIVLMAHRGRQCRQIAADLGLHRRSVACWLNSCCAGGLEALRPRKAKGPAAKAPDALAGEVRRRVIEGPAGQGLDRAGWTYEELADHLYKARGIKTSRSAVQCFCTKIDIRLCRSTHRYLRGDREAAQAGHRGVKKRARANSSC
jgi:transposase